MRRLINFPKRSFSLRKMCTKSTPEIKYMPKSNPREMRKGINILSKTENFLNKYICPIYRIRNIWKNIADVITHENSIILVLGSAACGSIMGIFVCREISSPGRIVLIARNTIIGACIVPSIIIVACHYQYLIPMGTLYYIYLLATKKEKRSELKRILLFKD